MNKFSIILITLIAIKSQNGVLTGNRPTNLSEVDFNAANVTSKSNDYTLDFANLCPNVPSQGAIDCLKNFKLSQYVTQIMKKDELPATFLASLVGLAQCNVVNLPSTEISLNVYCYLEGIKESILTLNKDLTDSTTTDSNAVITLLNEAAAANPNKEVKAFLLGLIDDIKSGNRSVLELVGEIDQERMEDLQDARANTQIRM